MEVIDTYFKDAFVCTSQAAYLHCKFNLIKQTDDQLSKCRFH